MLKQWKVCAAALMMVTAAAQAGEAPELPDWAVQWQSTWVGQAKPSFASPYQGAHSLVGTHENSHSFTATAALGWRVAPHTELYANAEAAQGVPMSGLTGLAGFTNGELARTSGSKVTVYRARLFARHTVPLADETDTVEPAMNQLAGVQAPRRWVFTAGNLSVLDVFDANTYNHDPRTQFLNWTVMTHGAWDFAADARGYTWGAVAEYIDRGWAVRVGRFIQPREPNGQQLDPHIARHYGDQLELQRDYEAAPGAPGTVRLLAWRNKARMARYADALAAAAGGAPSLDAVRGPEHTKAGAGMNVEQALGAELGLFGRAMWADGRTETYAFTEADRSASFGAALKGTRWGREADTLGLALASNHLSGGHRAVLAQGGLTFFLGDGQLRYQPERIVEAYYAWQPTPAFTVSADVQRIAHPGYNADRGPVNAFGLRLHTEL